MFGRVTVTGSSFISHLGEARKQWQRDASSSTPSRRPARARALEILLGVPRETAVRISFRHGSFRVLHSGRPSSDSVGCARARRAVQSTATVRPEEQPVESSAAERSGGRFH